MTEEATTKSGNYAAALASKEANLYATYLTASAIPYTSPNFFLHLISHYGPYRWPRPVMGGSGDTNSDMIRSIREEPWNFDDFSVRTAEQLTIFFYTRWSDLAVR